MESKKKVRLILCGPAVAEKIRPFLNKKMMRMIVDPYYPPNELRFTSDFYGIGLF